MIGNLNKKDILALVYITLLSIIAVVYGFSIIPSPLSEQSIASDNKRVEDLSNIQTAVDAYYLSNNELPVSLNTLTTQAYDSSTPLEKNDPITHEPYTYQVIGTYDYKLCATFATDSSKNKPDQYDTTTDYSITNGSYIHPAGSFCFTEREQQQYTPPTPSGYPFPCRTGRMCPMIQSQNKPTPAIYNGTNISPSSTP